MTVLVTGAGGFLGGHLCRALRAAGHVTLAMGRPEGAGRRRVDTYLAMGDLPATDWLVGILRQHRPGCVYHLAGTVSAPSNEALYRINLTYALRLLDACAALVAPPRVILLGSAAEYGPPEDPLRDLHEAHPTRPVSAYGASKLAQTQYALSQYRVPVVVARAFNPIGVGMPTSGAAGRFVSQVAELANTAALDRAGGVIDTGPLHGIRDLVAAQELAGALVALAAPDVTPGRIYNLCTGVGTTMRALTEALTALAPFPVRFQPVGSDAGVDRAVGDPSRLAAAGITLNPPDLPVVLGDMLRAAGVEPRNPSP
ncbi:NAD-dependent epimerase/dehydratase family protein [Billgrantia pellis]|uniref:NAD-dependent epimerase/dehydratase family protein n=1 Tax=Billgrantia pellis TaxID=2606936 RepID=UPI001658C692|nr:NAD-dependent epimerase/dehydratase family protein [Halomonas pellis]